MGETTNLAHNVNEVTGLRAGDALCEGCRTRPAEVLVDADGEGFRVCVECAADGVRQGRARFAGAVTS